jgi:hypothetical protein
MPERLQDARQQPALAIVARRVAQQALVLTQLRVEQQWVFPAESRLRCSSHARLLACVRHMADGVGQVAVECQVGL